MEKLNLNELAVAELTREECQNNEGGLFFLLATLASNALVVGTIAALGAAIYASAEAGYNQACGCN
jgi:hypothetical protein